MHAVTVYRRFAGVRIIVCRLARIRTRKYLFVGYAQYWESKTMSRVSQSREFDLTKTIVRLSEEYCLTNDADI